MAFEFLTSLDNTHFMLLLIIFILFVVSMKKAFSIVVNLVWAAGISLLFPVVMNRFFGFEIPLDPESLLSFMTLGVGMYFIYVLGAAIYKILGIAEKTYGKIPKPSIHLPKGQPEGKNDLRLREKELKLKEKELKLKEKEDARNEQHAHWMSRIDESKKVKRKPDDDYVELKETKDSAGPERKNFAEPLKEMKKKKKDD